MGMGAELTPFHPKKGPSPAARKAVAVGTRMLCYRYSGDAQDLGS